VHSTRKHDETTHHNTPPNKLVNTSCGRRAIKATTGEDPITFFGIRVTNEQIIEKAANIQKQMCRIEGIDTTMLDMFKAKIHLTLLPVCISSDEEMQQMNTTFKSATKALWEKHFPSGKKAQFSIKGVGQFSNRVVWAGLEADDTQSKLCEFVSTLHNHLEKENRNFIVQRLRFNPHLTLYKSSFGGEYKLNATQLQQFCTEFSSFDFGSQPIEEIQLLKMGSTDTDGFYCQCSKLNVLDFTFKG